MGLDVPGREHLVVVVKGTFSMPRTADGVLRLLDEQEPLTLGDTFTDAPGASAPRYESDFALRKHACDVLLHGSAYTSEGRPETNTTVGLRVGQMSKGFRVVGDRVWSTSVTGIIRATSPQRFSVKPISYDVAFGGVDDSEPDAIDAATTNPIGRGFSKHCHASWLEGRPLPSTEAIDEPILRPGVTHPPQAFGPVGRWWAQRACWAGTYDAQWLDRVFPFLPQDFDERYYQSSPVDQQLPIPTEALDVVLLNLTCDGRRAFTIPYFDSIVHIAPKQGVRERHRASLDTILFEPDAERVILTWRVCRPLKRDLFEVDHVQVGGRGREAWGAAKRSKLGGDGE